MTGVPKLLVANRGEIALRVFRAANTLGIATVGVYPADDATSLHVSRCDETVLLPGTGAAAYLDAAAVVAAARQTGADSLHPGYGFLSESAGLARACANAGLTFVGPEPDALEAFGDKGTARELAADCGVPVVPGTSGAATLPEIEKFLRSPGTKAVVIKAVAGGGGRGMRVVRGADDLPEAVDACRAEAGAAFGNDDLYAERLVENARHIEVQILGDGTGEVIHLWDRDCSVQRRHQKIIEVAPAGGIAPAARDGMLDAACRLAGAVRYRGLATVEFLATPSGEFFFLEVNPRVQVEHTITEEVTGVDLVRAQIQVAAGATLSSLGLTQREIGEPRGSAIQVRVNAETMTAAGQVRPEARRIARFEMPSGHGIRVETAGYAGYPVSPRFDSLLAKIVVHDRSGFDAARRSALRALAETRIEGVGTNLAFDHAILASEDFAGGRCDTRYVDAHLPELLAGAEDYQPRHAPGGDPSPAGSPATAAVEPPSGALALTAPMSGSVTSVEVAPGDTVTGGQLVLTLEAMKMQHVVRAAGAGEAAAVLVAPGDVVAAGDPLVFLTPSDAGEDPDEADREPDPDFIRTDLSELFRRTALLSDEARPEAAAKRHARGQRTARENVADLVDEGTFTEYGGLAVAAQRTRRDLDDLIRNTPADGIITGTGKINGDRFGPERAQCAVLAYDYTVLAGTQGYFNHRKTDRVLTVARDRNYPVVLFAEGGGGRPGDVDVIKGGGLITPTFTAFGALSGHVPVVGIVAGRCFAGNAALLGACDVIIATRDSNIGMGGPAMIEGGGLGACAPEDIGPIGVQTANGVVDVAVADETEAVAVAKQYLSYFQGDVPFSAADADDQRRLRHVVPENRKHVYDVHRAIDILFDTGSVLELRPSFGRCVVTALVRIGGRAMGLLANNPMVLGGAIDADGADKAARFLQLCEVFGLPVVSLVDTPGFMVGPESEKTATVRHFGRMFVRGGNLTVPVAAVVLRKSYGLGAMAMTGGSLHDPVLTVSWPSGEFGGMGLEGAVRLGFRKELEAIADPAARERRFEELVARMYQQGSALNQAMHLEIDDVIDPADTRDALLAALPPVRRDGWINPRARLFVDTW